jgi:hypothetical protein
MTAGTFDIGTCTARCGKARPPSAVASCRCKIAVDEYYLVCSLSASFTYDGGRFLQGRDHSVRLSMLYWNDELDDAPDGAAARAAPALY